MSASLPGRFSPKERTPAHTPVPNEQEPTYMGPSHGLDALEYRNISCPKLGFEPRFLYRPEPSLVIIPCLPRLIGLCKILVEKTPLKFISMGK